MKSHVLRPLYVVLAIVAGIFLARPFIVPADFGVHESGYMYGWYRKGNEEDWKNFKIKFKTREYCKDCHPETYSSVMKSPHSIIHCENCHGLAADHPEDPAKLSVPRQREHCLRCHSALPYPSTGRASIRGIDPDEHNTGVECVSCHSPHSPVSNPPSPPFSKGGMGGFEGGGR